MAAMARRSPQEIQALKEEAYRREQELQQLSPEQQMAFARSSEGRAWAQNHHAVSTVAVPIPRVLAGLLGRLTPQQWSALREWSAATSFRVGIRLDVDRLESSGTVFLNTNASPHAGPADVFSFGPGADLMIAMAPQESGRPPTAVTPERRAKWEQDPVLGRRETFQPRARPAHLSPGVRMPPMTPHRELLPELARVYGANFISDAYWGTGTMGGVPTSAAPVPLFQHLERLFSLAYEWDQRGSLIRLRSRTWVLERPREVPLRFVRRWRESYERNGALSLAQYLDMVTQLRDIQLVELPTLVTAGALPSAALELLSVFEARSVLRLYARLPAPRQAALRAGRPLRVAEMPPVERALFTRAIQEVRRARTWSKLAAPEEGEEASLSLSTHASARPAGWLGRVGVFPGGPGPAGVEPGSPPPAAPPGQSPAPAPPGQPAPGLPRPPGLTPPRAPAPQFVERWEFFFQVGSGARESVSITTATAQTQPAGAQPRER